MIDPGTSREALPTTSEVLPPLYAGWMAELLPGPIPRESRATCDNCAMVAPAGRQHDSREHYFSPAIKCCTYVPTLRNFLTGRILADTDPTAEPGKATVIKRIAGGIGVTPLGLAKSPVFKVLYERASTSSFGRNRTLVCPHYLADSGRCGIWRHRESTCTTWFCKHLRGDVGFHFWRRSLHQLLVAVEEELCRWCVVELEFDDDTLRHLFAAASDSSEVESLTVESLDNRVDRDSYNQMWGKWVGREQEFFVACARLVDRLTWQDVLEISGPEVRALARLTKQAYDRLMTDEIAPTLTVGSMQLVQITHDAARVMTYSEYDPLDIPRAMFEVLPYFDGRPTEEALAVIESEKGMRLDPALVRKMTDFELLVPPE
jgi:hypothetical protein